MKSCVNHFNLDAKQEAAFNIICSSFMLAHLDDSKSIPEDQKVIAKEVLNKFGCSEQLVMNLTGAGGCGKSFVLNASRSMCEQFCKVIGQPFNSSVFIITATTNSAAAQIDGDTIHTIAGLRRKFSMIFKNGQIDWKLAKILFIDEISLFSIADFKKLDRYLRHLMAQFNSDALKLPFGGLQIVFCGDFCQLNPIGVQLVYNRDLNALWSLINRVVILNMNNHRFINDPQWGFLLERLRKGFLTKEDIEFINTRVVDANLTIPSYEDLNGEDITYACSTNAERNIIMDNNFGNILKAHHPKAGDSFSIPLQTIIIKGNFAEVKTGKPKSSKYHNMIYNKCGDDKVTYGGKNSKGRVDPCLKLFVGCPIMVSTNDQKKDKVVKGTTGFFKGIILKENKYLKEEIWNNYKVYTIEANDVEFIVCERSHKNPKKRANIFHLPLNNFIVDVKYEIRPNSFVNLPKSKITQFPILLDLATTGHKLQGMTKKHLIVSSFNYGTANWIYVVLSRVTSIKGLYLLKPLKLDYNPKQSKLLLEELQMQQKLEFDTLLHLQKNGTFPAEINLNNFEPNNNFTYTEQPTVTPAIVRGIKRKRVHLTTNETASKVTNFDLWCSTQNLKRVPHTTFQNGNCLYESVSCFFDAWKGKPIELRLSAIKWAQNQILSHTGWGYLFMDKFEKTKSDVDAYGKQNFFEYLDYMKDTTVYGTQYDILLLCEFLDISIDVFSSSSISFLNGFMDCPPPLSFGNRDSLKIILWHENLHYEPVHYS